MSDNRKSQVRDNWEDDWENDDEIEAKLKANIEETKKNEIQNLVDKAEEELIEDIFLTDPLVKKVEQKQIKGHPLPLLRDEGEFGPTRGRRPRKPPFWLHL